MGMEISKEAYEKLIREDVEWLVENAPEDLERDHIIAVLRDSVNMHYPEEVESIDPMAYLLRIGVGAGYPEFDIKRLVADSPYTEEKKNLLEKNMWYVVYPFTNYKGESGWSYDIYYKYNGEWSDFSRNGIYSGMHLLPFSKTKEEAVREAQTDVESSVVSSNPEWQFYMAHVKYFYSHRNIAAADPMIAGAEVPCFHHATVGDLLDEWSKNDGKLVHTCPVCGAKSITVFISGNPLTGSKSMMDLCTEGCGGFSTSNKPGGYLSYIKAIQKTHEKSGLSFKDAYYRLKEKVEKQ